MTTARDSIDRPDRTGVRALHLFALCGFAVAQPLLDLLARYAELFVARRSEPLDVVLFVVGLVVVPPLVLTVVDRAASAVSARWGWRVHLAFVALLVALTVAPLANARDALPPAIAVALASLAGLLAAWLYASLAVARRFVSVLAFAPLAFVAVFAKQPPIGSLFAGGDAPGADAPIQIERPAPIVFVVFDELPLTSLLDAAGEIDASHYPGFARLAATSTWLRNATTVESRTLQAIPALLSGRYPAADRKLPLASQHPVTLFSLLEPSYAMNVFESLTLLHPEGDDERAPLDERLLGLTRDVALIYAHVVVPPAWSRTMPDVQRAWRDFSAGRTDARRTRLALHGRPTHFRRFTSSIEPQTRPGLHFVHSVLPHGPWQYLPSGASFYPHRSYGRFLGIWSEDEYFSVEAYQRHLLQTQLVDRLVGELLDHLEAVGMLDASILVVVADHGASFWPGDHFRDFESGAHPEDVLRVPLFVKRPGQRDAVVIDRNVETVDVLPSLLQLIGAPLPADLDGCSFFDPSCPERATRFAFSPALHGEPDRVRHEFAADLGADGRSLARKLAWFGDGPLPRRHFGAHADLVGRRLDGLAIGEPLAGTADLEAAQRTWQLGRDEPLVPVRLAGLIESDAVLPEPVFVAVAVDGVVETIVPAPLEGDDRRLVALLPEEAVAGRARALALFVVSGEDGERVLRPLPIRQR